MAIGRQVPCEPSPPVPRVLHLEGGHTLQDYLDVAEFLSASGEKAQNNTVSF